MRYGTYRVGVSARWYELAPPEEMELHLATSRERYGPGDPFLLSLGTGVPGEPVPTELYVALEADGGFWFWPSWGPAGTAVTCLLPRGWHRWDLLELAWPDGAGEAEGLRFHAALCAAGTMEPIGYGSCRWGYGP